MSTLFSAPDSPDGSVLMIAVFKEDDGRYFAEFQSGGEAGHACYRDTALGAVLALVQMLSCDFCGGCGKRHADECPKCGGKGELIR